ncbi:MAG: adenylate/guanylate cyclase domain-containing protein [bacterium]
MPPAPSLEHLVAALEAQRAALGNDAVDFAIAALRDRARVEPARVAPQPRLRQVTVLFCDIAGSTAMLERLGAEEAATIIGAALERFAAVVTEAGGKVLRFTGDGLKAIFGADNAREDDAERAVRAGLAILAAAASHADELRRAFGISSFAARVGINTGSVLLGAGPEADNAAMGHAVHIAARLEQHAPAGRLRIAHSTWLLVRGLFEVEAQAPLEVKGSAAPLSTYLVTSAVSSADLAARRGIEGIRPPLVGRDAELARLLATVTQARETAQAHAATVIGDAGLGKSRLVEELKTRLTGRATALLARSHPTSVLQPYGLLRDLVARWLGISDGASAASARARLVERLAPLLGEQGEAEAQRVGQLIGIEFPDSPFVRGLEGRALRDLGFRALRQALHRFASDESRAPLVLLLDDLHWADDGSLDFVEQLADGEVSVALLAFARPSLSERRPEWMQGRTLHTTVTLTPLDAIHGEALAAALLARLADAPPELRRLLVSRADGNPFFMEELVRMLIDDGVIGAGADGWTFSPDELANLRVPETLVGVLQARLDALPPAELAALQQASILGAVFWDEALAALDAGAAALLPALERRALVRARGTSAFDGCTELRFAHHILHDVTYGTVLKAARREGHARAARWLAERVGERAGEFLAVTAEHFERAGDSERALDYFSRATRDAMDRFAYEAAWAHSDRALAQPALESDLERRYWILSRRHQIGDAQGHTERRDQAVADMAALAEAAGDEALVADVLATRALDADRNGRSGEARALARQAAPLAERSGAATAATLAHGLLAWLAVTERDFESASRHLDAGIPWARRTALLSRDRGGHPGYELQLRLIGIESSITQRRLVEAAERLDQAIGLLGTGDAIDRSSLLSRRAMVARELGDLDGAERLAHESLAVVDAIGVPRQQAASLVALAGIAELAGDAVAQRERAARAVAAARTCDAEEILLEAWAVEASAWHALGDTVKARGMLDEAVARHRAAGRVRGLRETLPRLIDLDLAGGDVVAARTRADELLREAAESELPPDAHVAVWRALAMASDPRAPVELDRLQRALARVLAELPDEAVRQRVVRNLPYWREVERTMTEPSPCDAGLDVRR